MTGYWGEAAIVQLPDRLGVSWLCAGAAVGFLYKGNSNLAPDTISPEQESCCRQKLGPFE